MIGLSKLQKKVFLYCLDYVKKFNQPVPHQEIITTITIKSKDCSIRSAIASLIQKGYLRKSFSGHGNKTYYVLLKTIL